MQEILVYGTCHEVKSELEQIAEQLVQIHSPDSMEAYISVAPQDKIDCLIKVGLHPNDTFALTAEWPVIYVRGGLT